MLCLRAGGAAASEHWPTRKHRAMTSHTMACATLTAFYTVLASATHPSHGFLPTGVTVRGPVWNSSGAVTFGTFHVSAPAYQKDMGDWGELPPTHSNRIGVWPQRSLCAHACPMQPCMHGAHAGGQPSQAGMTAVLTAESCPVPRAVPASWTGANECLSIHSQWAWYLLCTHRKPRGIRRNPEAIEQVGNPQP